MNRIAVIAIVLSTVGTAARVVIDSSLGQMREPTLVVMTTEDKAVDITSAVNPVLDGYVSKLRSQGGQEVSQWMGTGQSRYFVELRSGVRDGTAPVEVLVELMKPGLGWKGNDDVPCADLDLVAVLDAERLIVNLDCLASFPAASADPNATMTRNVILYDRSTGQAINLTPLGPEQHVATEALAYFQGDDALLMVERDTVGAAENAFAYLLKTKAIESLDDHPAMKAWYLGTKAFSIKASPSDYWRAATVTWTVRVTSTAAPATFQIAGGEDSGLRGWLVDAINGAVMVSNPEIGTWLVRSNGSTSKLSDLVAIDYDGVAHQASCRSTVSDGDGQFSYYYVSVPILPTIP